MEGSMPRHVLLTRAVWSSEASIEVQPLHGDVGCHCCKFNRVLTAETEAGGQHETGVSWLSIHQSIKITVAPRNELRCRWSLPPSN